MAHHIVKKKSDFEFSTPSEFAGRSTGYTRDDIVDEATGSVQMGFHVARLDPDGRVDTHVHSFEESLYVDDCCHVTPRGYEILGRAIAERLIADLE